MMAKENLNTIAIKIEEILTKQLDARNDDNLLYAYFLNSLGVSVKKTSFFEIMRQVVNGYLPSMESVSRVRRKVQEIRPALIATAEKRKIRYKAMSDYKNFAYQTEVQSNGN